MLTKSNAVGYAVLAVIVDRLNESEFRNLHIEPYLNGRESGFAVNFFLRRDNDGVELMDRKFAFAEMRGCDAVAVYEGKSHMFNMLGNGLTEAIYRNCRTFNQDQIVSAAQYVVNRLREPVTLELTPA